MAGSWPLSSALVPVPVDTQYSTLEVDNNRWLENDGTAAPIVVQDPKNEKIVRDNGLGKADLIVGQDPKDEKVVIHNNAGKEAVDANLYNAQAESSPPTKERKIFGLRRRTFFILSLTALVLIIAGAVGGGVGGTIAARNRNKTATATKAPTTSRVGYANTGLAAMLWTDLNGTLHKRLYYQDNKDKIRESAWDNSTSFNTTWQINAISNPVKPGTPIAAAAGYPHASYNYSLVRITHLSLSATG